MPLFDFLCTECGKTSEVLITRTDESPACRACGSTKLTKLLSAHSSLSGTSKRGFPGCGDTACCAGSPGNAGCAVPGSCCGNDSF
ncbi:MAG: FmdB family zinc ribbon protein [Syntrophobacteraceae bacterium]